MKYTKLKKMLNTNFLQRVSASFTALAVFVTQTGLAATLTLTPLSADASTSNAPFRSEGRIKEAFAVSTKEESIDFTLDFKFKTNNLILPFRFIKDLVGSTDKLVLAKQGPFQEQFNKFYKNSFWKSFIDDSQIFEAGDIAITENTPQTPIPNYPKKQALATAKKQGNVQFDWSEEDPSVPEAGPVIYRYKVLGKNQVVISPTLSEKSQDTQKILRDGDYNWRVQTCDQAIDFKAQKEYKERTQGGYRPFNHCSEWSKKTSFLIDNTEPSVSLNHSKEKGTAVSGTLTFTGSATDKRNNGVASGVKETKLFVQKGGEVVSKIFEQDGEFIWDTNTVDDGEYTVVLQAKDKAGNVGKSKEYTFTVDNQDPDVTINKPVATEQEEQSTTYLNSWNGTISGKTTGDVENVNLQIVRTQDESKQVWNGTKWVSYSENSKVTVSAQGIEQWQYNLKDKTDVVDAEYSVTAQATEQYHIEPDPKVASDKETFVYDTTSPKQENVSLVFPAEKTKYVSEEVTLTGKAKEGTEPIKEASFLITPKNEGKKKVVSAQKDTEDRTYKAQWDSTEVRDGMYEVVFQAADRAGNTTDSKKRTLIVDNEDAQVQITTPTSETEEGVVYTNQWDGTVKGNVSGDTKNLELLVQKTELNSSEEKTYVWDSNKDEWKDVANVDSLPRVELDGQLQEDTEWQFMLPEQAKTKNSRFTIQAFVTEEYSQEENNEEASNIVKVQYDTQKPQGTWTVEQVSDKEIQISWKVTDASGIEPYILKTTNPDGETSQQSFEPQVTSTKIATKDSGDWQFSLQAKDRAGNTKTFSDSTVQIAIEENSSENEEQSDQNTEGGSNTNESSQDNSDTDSSNTGAEQDKNANEESNSSEDEDQSSTDDSQQSKEKETSETDTESDTAQEESTQQNDQSSSDNDSQSDSSENSQDKNANEGNVTIPKEEPQSETDTEESEEDQPTNEDTSSNEESQSSDSQSPEEDNNSSSDTSDESTEEEQRGSSEGNTSGTEESGTEEQSSSFQNQEVALEPEASSNTTTTTDSEANSTENESESNAETIYTGSAAESSNEQSSEQEGTPVLQARLVDFVQNSWPYLLFIFVVALIGYGVYRGRNENS